MTTLSSSRFSLTHCRAGTDGLDPDLLTAILDLMSKLIPRYMKSLLLISCDQQDLFQVAILGIRGPESLLKQAAAHFWVCNHWINSDPPFDKLAGPFRFGFYTEPRTSINLRCRSRQIRPSTCPRTFLSSRRTCPAKPARNIGGTDQKTDLPPSPFSKTLV